MNYTTIVLPTDGGKINGRCCTDLVFADSPEAAARKVFEQHRTDQSATVLVVGDLYTHAFKWDVPPTPEPTVVTA